VRFATYNASLYEQTDGGLIARLEAGDDKARQIAAVIQHQRPDVLLLNEFDYDDREARPMSFSANISRSGSSARRRSVTRIDSLRR
jgi:hypothetical protein